MGRWARKRIAPTAHPAHPAHPVSSCFILFHPAYGLWRLMFFLIKAARMAIAQLLAPTAYGDGLWGLQNTDITDAHGSIITDLLFFF